MVGGIPYLTEHPVSLNKDIAEYSEELYREWWNVPYVLEGEVWCLDGGTWDRPHFLGPEKDLKKIFEEQPKYRKSGRPFVREFVYMDTFRTTTFADGEVRQLSDEEILELHCWFLPE